MTPQDQIIGRGYQIRAMLIKRAGHKMLLALIKQLTREFWISELLTQDKNGII